MEFLSFFTPKRNHKFKNALVVVTCMNCPTIERGPVPFVICSFVPYNNNNNNKAKGSYLKLGERPILGSWPNCLMFLILFVFNHYK